MKNGFKGNGLGMSFKHIVKIKNFVDGKCGLNILQQLVCTMVCATIIVYYCMYVIVCVAV